LGHVTAAQGRLSGIKLQATSDFEFSVSIFGKLIINSKAVKQIGLTIPPNVMARADRFIK
jgi:ABC-type uncharacterized transport system substrate-binding protein